MRAFCLYMINLSMRTIVEIIECVQYKSMSYTIIIVYRFVCRGFCFAAAFGSLADVVGILRLRHFVGYVEFGRIFVSEFIECLYSLCPTCTELRPHPMMTNTGVDLGAAPSILTLACRPV